MRAATPTRRLDIGIGDLKASSLEAIDVVDLRSEETRDGRLLDVNFDSLREEYGIGLFRFFRIIEKKLKTAATRCFILGPHASELIAAGCFALQKRATVEEFLQTCHPHPTLSEALHEAALAVFGKPLHL